MDISSALFDAVVNEGEKYFFTADCPIGIPDYIHVCIKQKDTILLLSTCSSQFDTAYRIAKIKGYDMNTFPMFKKDSINKFQKDITYINCNQVVEIESDEFGELIKRGVIHKLSGELDCKSLELIGNGIKLSTEIERRIKEMFD